MVLLTCCHSELSVEDDGETAETAEEGEEETLGEWQTVVADSVQPDTKPAIGRWDLWLFAACATLTSISRSTGDTIDDDNAGSPITIRNRRKAKVWVTYSAQATYFSHETLYKDRRQLYQSLPNVVIMRPKLSGTYVSYTLWKIIYSCYI